MTKFSTLRSRISTKPVVITFLSIIAISMSSMAAQPGSESHINEAIGKAYAAYGVSEAVRAGDFLFIGGIVAFDDEGKVIAPGDGITQVEVVYNYIAKILADHGATARNVVKETHFVNNMEEFFAGAPTRIKFYDDAGAAYPTSVAAQVAGLVDPGLVFEVELVAYLGE